MFLSINPLLPEISLIIIDGNTLVEKTTLAKNLDTASTFPRHIIDILNRYEIDEIWCIVWPGPFTLMRIITLTCNAIHLARWIKLKWCHFFDILDKKYIPIIEANPSEYIVRVDNVDILKKTEELNRWSYIWISNRKDFTEGITFVEYTEELIKIQNIFLSKEDLSFLSPLYFKAPHITWSNKKTFPSSETVSA